LRGQPVSIRHRTAAEVAAAIEADRRPMRDPQRDSLRVHPSRKVWLIVTAACTVDQCLLMFGGGDFGGWACPCCGAQYDTSGRARKGPPDQGGRTLKNLKVPDYRFLDSHRVRFT
jgi:ubiquinol-cytochrome c reductase iron-sulfur subunit